MKKHLALLLCVSLLIAACEGVDKNTFVLRGKTNLAEGTQVYLVAPNANNQPVHIDTTLVTKGAFELRGDVAQIDVNFLFIEGEQENIPFIVEEGIISAEIFADSLNKSTVVGTSSNDDLTAYREHTNTIAQEINTIALEIQSANRMGDNLWVETLQSQYKEKQAELNAYELNFLRQKTNSYVSSLIMERFLNQKQLPVNEAKIIFGTYDPRIRSSRSGLNVSSILNRPVNVTAIGAIAPTFEGPTPEGESLSLEKFRGKVTIIDFWASWCRPCRIENPNLVRLYKRMHSKGLEIVGVSLDRNKASWERAIADDGLIWNHVSNLKYWNDPIAKLYSVRAIPAAFVLDKEGKIVAKNLRGAQLDAKIEELLAN